MSEMVDIFKANNIKPGERVWVKTMVSMIGNVTSCLPDNKGSVLCAGILESMGLGMKWDSIFVVQFQDPISKENQSISFSERDHGYEGCFFVEREK